MSQAAKWIVVVALTFWLGASIEGTLEERVEALEKWRDATVTSTKEWGQDEQLEWIVELRKKIRELEKRIEELEEVQ